MQQAMRPEQARRRKHQRAVKTKSLLSDRLLCYQHFQSAEASCFRKVWPFVHSERHLEYTFLCGFPIRNILELMVEFAKRVAVVFLVALTLAQAQPHQRF